MPAQNHPLLTAAPDGSLQEMPTDEVRITGDKVYLGDMEMETSAFAKMVWRLLLLLDARLMRIEERLGISSLDLNAEAQEITEKCFDLSDEKDLGFGKAQGVFNAIRNIRAHRKKNRTAGSGKE